MEVVDKTTPRAVSSLAAALTSLIEKDRLDNNIMKEYLKTNNLNISFPKIVNLYMSKGVNNKVCKIDGASKRAFIGLKQIFKSVLDNDNENDFI